MEVKKYLHAEFLCPETFDKQVLLAAPVAMCGRIHPDPETDSIQTEVLHECGTLHFLPLGIVQFLSAGLHFSGPTYICSKPEFRFLRPV